MLVMSLVSIESGMKNGQIKSEEHYKDVMTRDGKWTEWDENGQIKSEKNYKDGVCISGDCD